jgi:S-DNA-T family DNA segregation ATPase FtsK/SpoIIIE
MPALFDHTFLIRGNYLGNMFAYTLTFPFGPHRFGPYFITSFIVAVTALFFFRINPKDAFLLIVAYCKKLYAWIVSKMQSSNNETEDAEVKGEVQGAVAAKRVDKKLVKKETSSKEDAEANVKQSNKTVEMDPVERARQEMQEKELAAFRAKRNEPIQITTMSIAEEPIEPENIPEPEIDPSLIENSEIPEGDGIAVPKRVQKPQKPYKVPEIGILTDPPKTDVQVDNDAIIQNSHILEKTLLNFGIEGKVFNVCSGPVVTRYEIELAPGVKVSKVVNLQDDISMAVGGQKIRIEAPIPGKAAIGIELPNKERQTVYFKNIMLSETFKKAKVKLPMIVGQNISGAPYVTDIAKMPHLLIAGQTGAGKSVCINSILGTLLMTKTPEELRLIMVDPKKVELAIYEGIPHLMSPVVTESKEAVKALWWAVGEVERRFRLLAKLKGIRNIESFNAHILSKQYDEGILTEDEAKPLPYLVVFVDELADLMLTASKDVESHIQRIAQLGRAAGIHLIVATQRPSVDIITGPIKANLTSRIAFRTIQSTDSRTILGHVGAEKLLGNGDMLFLRNGAPDIERFHGAFLTEEDVEKIVKDITSQNFETDKFDNFTDIVGDASGEGGAGGMGGGERDEFFDEAARLIVSIGQGSTSLLQRRMKIGYARAGRIMDELCDAGIVGPADGSKMREVRMKPDELEQFLIAIKG